MSTFDRYAPFIQDYIYQHGWKDLRAVQVAAADAIFDSDENVLLAAGTASGKTEAAFFPILSRFLENPPASVGCIYIAPLKALINDQFERLTDLCQAAGIPVWHWHGDVSQSEKKRLLEHPSGILQTTPESLEAILLHKHGAIPTLFSDLRYVVIDEVHSLLRGDRGRQALCQIERICRLAGCKPRRIGLSATIGDPQGTAEYLSRGTGRGTVIPKIAGSGTKWRLSMEHFYVKDTQASEGKDVTGALPLDEKSDQAPKAADPGYGYIFEHTRGKKCLVFCNSREEAEAVTTTLRHYAEVKGEPDRFLIHHGNLSSSFRESTEDLMKEEDSRLTTITTATLELGIDIGRLERAFQIDAPFTVSSFLQRMGRTGRRGQSEEMWFVIREQEPEPRAMLPQSVPWKLIQAISLIQLYLEEKWVEPADLRRLPYSLLYHQTMATLASSGELSPPALAKAVLTLTPFGNISRDDYQLLLRHLVSTGQIEKTAEGGLIVGIKGEKVVNNFRFYAVFQENEEFTVRSSSEELGTVVLPPPVGEKLAIAGHVWTVLDVDRKRHLVMVEPVKGKVPAYFGLEPGDINTKILERMKQVLQEDNVYPYLMKNAVARLDLARRSSRSAGIDRLPLVNLGGSMWALFPWLGSYAFLALERLLKLKCAGRLGLRKVDPFRPYFMQLTMTCDEATFCRVVAEEARALKDPMELVYPEEVPLFDKYDEYLPEALVRKGFAYGVLDIEGMRRRVAQWESMVIG